MVVFGYVYNYVFIIMMNFFKNLFCINGMIIDSCDIVFEEIVLVGNIKYNVKLICVVEG